VPIFKECRPPHPGAAQAGITKVERPPACDGLSIDLDDLWTEIDRLEAPLT
jgi:hypothetical protein